MRYLPKSDAERAEMLREIGASSIDDLFAIIPEEYRLKRDLEIPRQMGESEIVDHFKAAAAKNAIGYASFLGAGVYRHYRPVIIDSLVQRGEFLTCYTPYQAEITQGTLQAIFEFQTMICELTGMDIANASMYDGSTGAAEAVMMAMRVTGRDGVVVARTVHPEYREVMHTYAQHREVIPHAAVEVAYGEDGRIDLAALDAAVTDETACVLVQSPNFFGVIEDVAGDCGDCAQEGRAADGCDCRGGFAGDRAAAGGGGHRDHGGAVVWRGARVMAGRYCGVIAAKEKYLRQMPGRLVGETTDKQGRRGFVLTLSTREQHIRREKATSNICTNQALVALMATIFLTVYGKEGMRELAVHNLAKADYAAKAFWARQAPAAVCGRAAVPRICAGDRGGAGGAERRGCWSRRSSAGGAGAVVSRAGECELVVRDGADIRGNRSIAAACCA